MSALIDDNFRDELSRMEMLPADGEPTSLFFVVDKKAAEPHIRIALEQAESYEADAVFFRIFPEGDKRSPIPQIYVYRDIALTLNEKFYANIHLRLWNAGVVPLVFVITSTQVKILNCRQEPDFNKERQEPVYTPFHKLEDIVAANQAFVAREVAAGTLWENPIFKNDFVLENTAYFKLLSHLKEFRQKLLKLEILSEQTVNRILVMAILVKYLNDRKDSAGNRVFVQGFLRRFSHASNDDLESLFREMGSCIRLFDHLSAHFNGGIFELTNHEKSELEQADLSPIADFLKGDQDPTGQMLFWPLYSFQDLPVELISNIYEEFLAKNHSKTEKKGLGAKGADKESNTGDKGIVYTPPMLVDFLLDQCLPLSTETLFWKILDPACGSGIFLVGAFKRLIQCWRIANDWRQPTHLDLKGILKNNIFGFDEKPEAVLITAFSLCVALCDELEPLVIWNKLKFDNLQKRNLSARDFFEVVESGEFNNHFDLIIGNPPFESKLTTVAAKRVEAASITNKRPKLPDTQLALLFLEQSFRLARKNAAICLIQPAGPLLYNGNALPFRSHLFGEYDINQVFDFTPLEGVLFSKAQVAAAAIIGCNAPATSDKILHVTFRRTRAIKEKLLFELDPYDFHWIARGSITKRPYAWKTNLLGGGRLHRMLDRLFSDAPTLGEYLKEKKINDGWQFGEGYSVGNGSDFNSLPNVKELAELKPDELKAMFDVEKIPEIASWITGKLNVPPEALLQKGINWKAVKPCEDIFFERTRNSKRLVFSPPHVLIREKVDGLAIPAAYSDNYLVFTNQIVGVHAPENERGQLRVLAKRLNESKLYGVLAALVSGRILVGRSNSLYASDIMSLPYPDDMQDIDLNFWEQALVEDIGNYLVDFRRKGEKASVLTKTNESDLHSFGDMYCNILNPVYKKFSPLPPILMDSFICYPFCYGDAPRIELPKEDTVVPYLEELLQHQHSSRLFVNRILRLYEQNVIFMIKPNQKRYWLRSIALRDADETLIDLLGQGY
ncbi:N-6 DNA methylase [Geobacter sp. FeAm09]|uniref:HsdM family class I SAM-dependent methyltransferase n=1 Tax=Geobacter sp. FeAm09 TaxID=2597769 RepID=UPI0011ED5DFE|nr:N-6 DNA methylase [Geobacter sp. FeAm09]QEM69789.1 N-6 DNA methylase [Geobacter sp. FeAm09]